VADFRKQYYDEVMKSREKMSTPVSENIAKYAIVGFDNFMDAKTFLDRINRNSGKMKGSEFPALEKVEAEIAPDPYDID